MNPTKASGETAENDFTAGNPLPQGSIPPELERQIIAEAEQEAAHLQALTPIERVAWMVKLKTSCRLLEIALEQQALAISQNQQFLLVLAHNMNELREGRKGVQLFVPSLDQIEKLFPHLK